MKLENDGKNYRRKRNNIRTEVGILKMVVRWVEAESTSPSTCVKHLPNLLRNKANSQQYPSIYKDRRPKSIEDTGKTDGKGIALG